MTITITLPFPSSKLMPNRKNGTHWASTIKEKEKAKSDGYYAAIAHKKNQFKPGVKIMFYCPDRRKRDLDNLYSAIKALQDGVCLGLGIDDSYFHQVTLDKTVDRLNPRVEMIMEVE